jgi:AraC family transcriptional activator FtrA
MAAHSGMSRRTFQRKFKDSSGMTPLEWLVRERVALAVQLLESRPTLGVDMVAELAGFGSAESLRRHFRRHGRPAPASLRRRPSV